MSRHADPSTATQIRDNWLRVSQQVADACHNVGRSPTDVKIVGVAKYVDAALTAQLVEAGCSIIGENRPQLLWEKHDWFLQHQLPMPRWHLIGHFQRNKVRRSLPLLDLIESVDSLRLAEEISTEAVRIGRTIPILVDVNVSKDVTKTGMSVDLLINDAERIAELPNLNWCGLMAMSTLDADSVVVAKEFSSVRELRDRLQVKLGERVKLCELSMGMSGDFAQAIAAGSTIVRIGSSLWKSII